MTKDEQIPTKWEQESPQSSNLENEKNEVNGSINYFLQYCLDPIDLSTKAAICVSSVSK